MYYVKITYMIYNYSKVRVKSPGMAKSTLLAYPKPVPCDAPKPASTPAPKPVTRPALNPAPMPPPGLVMWPAPGQLRRLPLALKH